jgi:uncharacterized protein YdaU (DUF1376 family)
MHYYQFNIGDYASHTRHLSIIEDIAYRRLLDLYYLHERPLGDCSTNVARLIGMSQYSEEVETVLMEFFEHIDGGFINSRADKEIAHYHSKIEQASRAGKASAERRSIGSSTSVQPNIKQETITINQEPKVKTQRGSRLPTDWTLPEEWKAWAEQERPDLATKAVADSFKDFWIAKAGAGGVKLDWQATWRNWIRSQSAPKTFVNKYDVAHITTPPPPNQDAALRKIEEDSKRAAKPSLEVLAKMAELRKKVQA